MSREINVDEILKKNNLYPDRMKEIFTKDGNAGSILDRTHSAIKDILEQYTELVVENATHEGYFIGVDQDVIRECLKQVKF